MELAGLLLHEIQIKFNGLPLFFFVFLFCVAVCHGLSARFLFSGTERGQRIAVDVTGDLCDGPALVAVGDVDVDGDGSDEFGPDPSSELLLIDNDLVLAEMEINLPPPCIFFFVGSVNIGEWYRVAL
jgi:hypothetical protein